MDLHLEIKVRCYDTLDYQTKHCSFPARTPRIDTGGLVGPLTMDYIIVHQDRLCSPEEAVSMFKVYGDDIAGMDVFLMIHGISTPYWAFFFKMVEQDRQEALVAVPEQE
jgi:hypothetical protein